MSKTPLFAIALATLGLAGVPALASPSPAGGCPQTLASSNHATKAAGTVLAQNEQKPSDQGNESSDSDSEN